MQRIFKEKPYTLVVQMTREQLATVKANAHKEKVTVSQFIRKLCK